MASPTYAQLKRALRKKSLPESFFNEGRTKKTFSCWSLLNAFFRRGRQSTHHTWPGSLDATVLQCFLVSVSVWHQAASCTKRKRNGWSRILRILKRLKVLLTQPFMSNPLLCKQSTAVFNAAQVGYSDRFLAVGLHNQFMQATLQQVHREEGWTALLVP